MPFVRDAIPIMIGAGVVIVPLAARILGAQTAVGLASGMGWALANVWALAALVTTSTGARHVRFLQYAGLWILKLPLLYTIGGFLALSPWSSPVGFLAGFSLWFVCLMISAFRRGHA